MADKEQKEYFFIKSTFNGRLLSIKDHDKRQNAAVVALEKARFDSCHQQWYKSEANDTIRSRLNDFCLTRADNKVIVHELVPGRNEQEWIVDVDGTIKYKAEKSKVIECSKKAGGDVKMEKFDNSKPVQQWKFVNIMAGKK